MKTNIRCVAIASLLSISAMVAVLVLTSFLHSASQFPSDDVTIVLPPPLRASGCVKRITDADYEMCGRYSAADCPKDNKGVCMLGPVLSANVRLCVVSEAKLRRIQGATRAPTLSAAELCVPPSECPGVLTAATDSF